MFVNFNLAQICPQREEEADYYNVCLSVCLAAQLFYLSLHPHTHHPSHPPSNKPTHPINPQTHLLLIERFTKMKWAIGGMCLPILRYIQCLIPIPYTTIITTTRTATTTTTAATTTTATTTTLTSCQFKRASIYIPAYISSFSPKWIYLDSRSTTTH